MKNTLSHETKAPSTGWWEAGSTLDVMVCLWGNLYMGVATLGENQTTAWHTSIRGVLIFGGLLIFRGIGKLSKKKAVLQTKWSKRMKSDNSSPATTSQLGLHGPES